MADKIQVAVRVRPVLFQKKDVEVHWGCDKGMIYQIDPGTRKRLGNPYLFDQVFEPHTQNHQIFASLVQPLIDSAMDGFNVTVLAYGQTASGKTYTMMGSQKECGIVQLAVDRIFSTIEQNPERAFLLRCSYIEIYNETISDLLSTTHQKLKLQELAEGNVIVHNLIETNVNSPDSVIKLMQQGNKQRKVGGTSMNERSSRSHTIFRIIVESVPRAEADRSDAAVMVSHINLVDLAGSEKASQTHATGDRFREGCAINTSLSALSLVIKQLSEGEGFVNFRDSKLTHILRASLGGNARTAIICNVTPTVLDETSSTLKFACSAKTVQNQPHVNEVLSDQALLRKYNNYIKDLEKKLKEKEQEQRPEALEEMERLLQEKEMKIQELKEKLVTSSVNTGGDNQMSASQRSLRRMTWGGNRLKQMLNFPPAPVFENAPVFASVGINRTRRVSFKSRKSDPSSFEDIAEGDSMDSESFVPAEVVFAKPGEPVTKVDAATMTELPQASPFRKPFESPFRRPQTPGTPVPVLRERMMQLRKTLEEREQENSDLREELEDLSNFTRLEQQIGVHVQATAKTCTSQVISGINRLKSGCLLSAILPQDTAEQLHQALQTANDMEVLYLDTQRKLSELQTQFREKEVEHANEVESLTADFQQRLDGETSERKRLARELSVLKEKHERLERDQAEADTHLQVVTERHVKREADLRQSLQEAWAQLEGAGQDPAAFREGLAAKEKVVQMGKEIEEMQSKYEEAQAQIRALSEELKCAKETANESALVATDQVGKMSKEIEEMQSKYEEAQAQILALSEELKHSKETTAPHVFTSPKVDELDSSLGGVCLADELRDVFMEQDSSLVRSSVRPRKRPSSILSVALAKMEQSACMLDGEQDVHPVKKTRFSVASMQTEDLDIREVKEIREYLVELQAVLVRYEEDYEILSQEKEAIVNQLIATQKEVASLREAPSFTRTTRRSSAREDLTPDKIDAFSEDFEASCIMEEHSVVASNAETELTGDAVSTPGESRAPQETVAVSLGQELLNEELDQLKRPNEILESSLLELTGKLQLLQEEIEAKTSALEAAVSASRTLEMVIEEKDEVISSLRKVNDDVLTLRDESQSLMDELENTRSALAETRSKLGEVTEEKESCSSKLSEVNEELESIKNELKIALEQIQTSQEQLLQSNSLALEMDLAKAHDRIRELEVEIELKTSEVEGIRASLEEASRRTEELELRSVNESNGELATALNKIKELEAEIEIKTSEVQAVQTALEQACVRAEELERKAADDSNEQLATALKKIAELEEELNVKISETETAQMRIKEASSDLQVLKNELNAKEDELNAVKAELAEVRGAVEKFSEEKQERISSLEAEIAQANDQIKALGAKLEEAASCDQQETDCSEREKLEELVERLTCQLEELEQKVEEKDQLLNDARDAAYQTSVQQKEATEAERQKCQKEVDALTEQSNDLRVQLEALSAELERVKQELLDSSAQVGELLLSKQSLELQLQSAEQKLGESKEEASGNAAVESAHISKLETELEEARKRIEELQFSNDFLQADLTSAEVRSGELEAQLDAKNEALRRAESANDALDEIRQQLTVKVEQVGELRTKLEEADIQIADLCSQREEVQAKLNEAKQRVQSLEEDVESERDALFATQRAAKEASEVAEAKLTELEAEKAVLIQQLDVATKEVEKLQLSVETVTTELQAARAQIATLEESNRLNSVPRENLTALEQEWKEALLKVSELESLLETETSKFDDARQNMEAAQSEVEQLNGQLKKYSAEIESLQRNIGDLSNRNASQNEHIEQLETNLRAMEDEVSNLRTSSGKISALENQLEALNGEIAHLSRVIEEKTEKINSLEDELTYVSQGEQCRLEQIQHMEKKLKERQVELEETRCLLVSMQTENEKISFDLSDKENQNVELRKSLGDFNQRFDTVQAKLEAVQAEKSRLALQLQRLEAEVDCREQELQGLRGGMESLHHEREMCQQLKQRLSALQSEKEAAVQLCERLREARDELVKQQDRLTQHVQELESKLQTSEWAKKNVEQTLAHYDSEKDALLKNHQRLKEELVLAEGRWKEETRRMAGELQVATSAKETLERIVAQYESQKETLVQEYQRLKEALLSTEERLGGEVRQLSDHLKASNAARNALEQDMAQFEGLKEASKQMKKTLADTEEQLKVVQAQRDEYLYQLKALSEQMLDARAKISAFESTSKYQTQRQLEDMIDALKRELVETRSSGEISRLNYEKEEENKKKKIERLEKEFEALKQQYVKCKEQLRLSRYKENEEGTVSIPKMRSSSSTTSTFVQTDPIADKGFGFRWQADRYSADNERLRVKVSELGERMEYYKEKLIKYRSLYFQAIGQDPNQRPHSGNSNPIQHLERRSSTSSSLKEHAIDNPVKEGSENVVRGRPLAPSSSLSSGLLETEQRDPARGVQTRSSTGSLPVGASRLAGMKKEALTKEEMEKINNCNPS